MPAWDETLSMSMHRAQATIEAVLVLGLAVSVVAALAAGGAFIWLPTAITQATSASTPESPARATADVAFLDRAIAHDADDEGPMLHDAILRLAQTIGPAAARAMTIDHLLRQYAPLMPGRRRALGDPSLALARPALNGVGPGATDVWSDESPRAPSVARIVTAADEARWRGSQHATLATHAVELGVSGAIALAGAINPETGAVSIGLGAGAAAMDVESIAIPSGSREDDVLLCRFVWRRNRAAPAWVARHPGDALRLALDQRQAAVELTVVRGGSVLSHDVVRSNASTC